MERLTTPAEGGGYTAREGRQAEAFARLATFETIFEDLVAAQAAIGLELEQLRNQGKKNSTKFKELLGKKLAGSNTLMLFKSYGIE